MSVPALVKIASDVDLRDDWTRERVEFVRKQYCGGAPDAVASAFIDICQRRRLAPEERHAYLTKRGDNWVVQTGIDGYRLIADRTRAYAGSDDPLFDTEEGDHPEKATVTVWKLVAGVRCPFTASARWSEYAPTDKRQGFMWTKMPYLMLGKCAEALALRKAFPAELSGIYTDAEMDQSGRGVRAEPIAHGLDTNAEDLPERHIEEDEDTVDVDTGELSSVAAITEAIKAHYQRIGWSSADAVKEGEREGFDLHSLDGLRALRDHLSGFADGDNPVRPTAITEAEWEELTRDEG